MPRSRSRGQSGLSPTDEDSRNEDSREALNAERPPSAESQTGVGAIAVRISRWTTNLLLSAVIVLVALVLGGKLLNLWRPIPPAPQVSDFALPNALDVFDDPQMAVQLDFGDSPVSIFRQQTTSDREEAVQQLLATCGRQLTDCVPPDEPPGESERFLLQNVKMHAAVERPTADTALYRLGKSFPMAVGIRSMQIGDNGTSVDRVVVWGLAVPVHDRKWTLYTFQAKPKGANGDAAASQEKLPIPPDTNHLLTLRFPRQQIVTFKATGNPQDWATFYDQWFDRRDWTRIADWKRRTKNWSCTFRLNENREDGRVANLSFTGSDSESKENSTVWRGFVTERFERPTSAPAVNENNGGTGTTATK